MAAVIDRLRTAGMPSRRRASRLLRRAWFAFTSVRTANVLLAAIFVAGLAGILVLQFGTSTLADPALLASALERLPTTMASRLPR